ncbi:MAG TPA: porin [Polyangiaceae bacterium]|nr:porin [Polyangiaceae bacterium]
MAVLGTALSFARAGAAQQHRQDVVDALLGRTPAPQVAAKPKRKPKSAGKAPGKSTAAKGGRPAKGNAGTKGNTAAKAKAKSSATAPAGASNPAPAPTEQSEAGVPERTPASEPQEAAPSPAATELPPRAVIGPDTVSTPVAVETVAPPVAPATPTPPEPQPGSAAVSAGADSAPSEQDAPGTGLALALYVDAYAAWQSSGSGTRATLSGHRAFSGQGSTFRAENGFSLAFVGLDASYELPRFGATASLRLGEGAPIYHAQADSESDLSFGVDLLTQAYATWRPVDPLAIDLGMFSTPFGAEVLESWRNLNYTRGALYYYAQPAWHTGLRLSWEASEQWGLLGFIADGTNNISETQQRSGLDQSPTIGAQLRYAPVPELSLALGGLFTLDSYHNDDAGFDAFGDFIASFELGGWKSELNADTILTRQAAPDRRDRHFLGFSLASGYAFSEIFGVAARGEYLLDDANFDRGDLDRWKLFTFTFTADFKPLPHIPNLILRWDNRWEESNQDIFGGSARRTADTADDSYEDVWFESVVGVVVTSAP